MSALDFTFKRGVRWYVDATVLYGKNRKFQLNLEIPQPHTYWANLVQINMPI